MSVFRFLMVVFEGCWKGGALRRSDMKNQKINLEKNDHVIVKNEQPRFPKPSSLPLTSTLTVAGSLVFLACSSVLAFTFAFEQAIKI